MEPGLATSVAWKYYDKQTVFIAAGRLAMHDCMGVVYQYQKIKHFCLATKVFLFFGKSDLFCINVNVTYIFVGAEVLELLMKVNNELWLGVINDMCLNVWKCVGVGIIKNGSVPGFWFWDLIYKFQSTFVVITNFLCWEINISIFIYQFLIISICYNIPHEIFTGFKNIRYKWLLFFIHFPLALFAEGAFIFKNLSGRFIYYCFLHIFYTIWLHFGSDAAG